MQDSEKVPIERKLGVTIYGKILRSGKLGDFEVYSSHTRGSTAVYHLLKDAQARMKVLLALKD